MRNLFFTLTYFVLAVSLVLVVFNGTAKASWGGCYNLQLLGKKKAKNDNTIDDWGGKGHRILVSVREGGELDGKTKILLTEGPFEVLDANGTDGTARFQLPANPCADEPGGNEIECPVNDPDFQCYSVHIAEAGKPCVPVNIDGTVACATIVNCATEIGECIAGVCDNDLAFGDPCMSNEDCDRDRCSTEIVPLTRDKGKPAWREVTDELTTVCIDTDDPPDGFCDLRVPLFDDDFEDFSWYVDNQNLLHAKLRFCPEEGDVCNLHPKNKKN